MDDEDEPAQIIVCQGPPRCPLVDTEAVAAAQAGCPWCRRIFVAADGREWEQGPVIA